MLRSKVTSLESGLVDREEIIREEWRGYVGEWVLGEISTPNFQDRPLDT